MPSSASTPDPTAPASSPVPGSPTGASTPSARRRRRMPLVVPLVVAALALAASLAGLGAAGTPASPSAMDGRGGNVTATLFQWPWTAVAEQCTTSLGPAGYAYVQVSPPSENIQGDQWWTSYQTVSYTLDNKLGNRAEFAAMVQTCHEAGVKVIADAVINHMTGQDVSNHVGTAGTEFSWRNYPGLYTESDFHTCTTPISNYQDRNDVQNCNLSSLADLDTGSEHVRQTIANYLNDLSSLGVDGFRIDAAKHMAASDLEAIKALMDDQSAYLELEVIGAQGEPITESEYTGLGKVNEFDYSRSLMAAFQSPLSGLRTFATGAELLPSEDAHVFVTNWDTERSYSSLSVKSGDSYDLANYFMLAHPYGDVNVFSGYLWTTPDTGAPQTNGKVDAPVCESATTGEEDGIFTCTHSLTPVEGMVAFRNATAGEPLSDWWDDGADVVAFSRGAKGFFALNGSDSAVTRTFATGLADGVYCDRITGGASPTADGGCAGTAVTVAGGEATATVPARSAVAIDADSRMVAPSAAASPLLDWRGELTDLVSAGGE